MCPQITDKRVRLTSEVLSGIASVKALLVVLYFMHVKYASKLTWLFVASGFFWLIIMLVITMNDYSSRGWM